MMSHGKNHQAVFPSLVDEAVWELGQHEPARTLPNLPPSLRVLTDAGEPSVDLICENRPQTGTSAFVVVDGVVELAMSFGVDA